MCIYALTSYFVIICIQEFQGSISTWANFSRKTIYSVSMKLYLNSLLYDSPCMMEAIAG